MNGRKSAMAILLVSWLGSAAAGTGYYVTLNNATDQPLRLRFGGADQWHPYDFAEDHSLAPHEAMVLYTENVGIGPGIVGLDVQGGKFGHAHIEAWQNGHVHSVTQNLSTAAYLPIWDLIWYDCRGRARDCDHFFGIGSDDPDITTSIQAADEGFYKTVYASVTFR